MVPRNAGHIECEGLVQIDGLDLLITQYFRGLLGDLEIEFVTVWHSIQKDLEDSK